MIDKMVNVSTFFANVGSGEGASKTLHLDVNRDDDQVVVASSAIFRIYDIYENRFQERANLRRSKHNLNYSCNSVVWNKNDHNIVATGATNGAVVVWNLTKSKQTHVFLEHDRTVNRVTFHPHQDNFLLSGSQDGYIKLFDIRTNECVSIFHSNAQSVRDVAFCPHGSGYVFATGLENGQIQVWDLRRSDRPERKWPAHSDHIFAVDWHPESRYTLASAGRDRQIKVWNSNEAKVEHLVYSIGPVGKIAWRPRHNYQIASFSTLVGDFSVNVWDVRRPYIPLTVFVEHSKNITDIKWMNKIDDRLLSGGKDNLLFHHLFEDGQKPTSKANPSGLAISNMGRVSHSFRDHSSITNTSLSSTLKGLPEVSSPKISQVPAINVIGSSSHSSGPSSSDLISSSFRFREFRPPPSAASGPPDAPGTDLFLVCSSRLKEYRNKSGSWTSTDALIQCARKYMLDGASFDVLCEHNAQVCEFAKQSQLSEAWRMMRLLMKNPKDIYETELKTGEVISEYQATSSGGAGGGNSSKNRRVSKSATTSVPEKSEDKHLEDTSASGDNIEDTGDIKRTNNKQRRSSSGGAQNGTKTRSKISSAESRENISGDEAADEDEEYGVTILQNIASGQMLTATGIQVNDFFGDSEIGTELTLENFTPLASTLNSSEMPLELKSEAFEPRVNLNVELPEDDDDDNNGNENGLGNALVGSSDVGGSDPMTNKVSGTIININGNNVFTVVVEDQTSALLCQELEQVQFNANDIIKDTLTHYAEGGDIQTAIAMFMVLRSAFGPSFQLIDDLTLELWFQSYIDLLHRFQLYINASQLIKMCPVASIQKMSLQSTTILSNCSKCNKALSKPQGSWWCERCKKTPNLCSVCQGICRGVYAWCQGCSHGGHLKCLQKWYKRQTQCPTGCGHHCEYQ